MVYAYVPNFVSIGLFGRPLAAKKPHFCQLLRFFGLRHLVVSLIDSSLRKLNTGAQLQTLPYPMVSKSSLYSNAFMAKSGAQSLTFKSVTNKQTNRQTDRQKTQRFWPPRRRVKSEPHQIWHGDRGLLYPPPFTNEGQIWCDRADPRSTLTGQISSECVHCVGFRWPKTTILGKF